MNKVEERFNFTIPFERESYREQELQQTVNSVVHHMSSVVNLGGRGGFRMKRERCSSENLNFELNP